MKIHLKKSRIALLLVIMAATGPAIVVSADSAPALTSGASVNPEPKTHTLFMGADISIERNKALYRVKDVSGGSFVIDVDGRAIEVPVDKGSINMKVDLGLKLTEEFANVADLKGERTYTPANDPNRKFAREAGGAGALAQADLTLGAMNNAQVSLNAANASLSAANNDLARGVAQASVQQAQASFNQAAGQFNSASLATGSDMESAGYHAMKLQEELDKKLFDAMELTFEVSSAKPLDSPYLVVIAWYREKDAKPGKGSTMIYARPLDPIDSRPRKVRFLQGGFPPGFELEKFQVHLYDQGSEVATNVAPRRVELTREEAFEYVLIEYLGSHKGATLPGAPAMGVLPADFHERLNSGKLVRVLYVRVGKDGKAAEAFLDEACTQPASDPYVVSLVKDIRFKPALNKGKPVESVVPLKLNQLTF